MTGLSLQLRAVALLTALAGIATLVSAQIAPTSVGVLAGVLVVGAAWMSLHFTDESARTNRRRLAAVALAVSALGALASSGGQISDDTAGALGVLLCSAAVAHSLVLDTVRDIRVNIAVSSSMLLLAAGLAPGLSIAVPVVLTWCCAVTALVLAAGEGQGEEVAVRATTVASSDGAAAPGGSTFLTAVAGCVTVAVLIGLALALVLPSPPGVSARSSFGAGDDRSQTPPGTANRNASAYLGNGPLSLDSRGKLSPTPIAVVTGTGGALWRATVLERYDGRSWWPGNDGQVRDLGGRTTSVTIPAAELSPPQPGDRTQRDGVGWLGPMEPLVLSPGLPVSLGLRETGRVLRGPDGRLSLLAPTPTPSYTVTSDVVPPVSQVRGPERGVDADAAVWTALPASVPARVTELARTITAGTPDRASAVRAVETYLRTNATYDLESPVAPPGADTVDDFLFNTRTGFCEHFASAEVVLLRSLGIPARLTSGFLSGPADAAGRTILRSSDAHAWVEVWIQGSGWVSSDPTAGTTLADRNGSGLVGVLQRLVDLATGSATSKVVLATVLVLLAAAAIAATSIRRRRRPVRQERITPSAPLFAAFRRYEDALDRTGRPRAPSESIRALARRPEAADDVVGALLTVERASYAGAPPTRDEARTAVDVIDRAAAKLLADVDA